MGTVLKRLTSYRPDVSTGIALLALFVALGGTATAAIVIKSSSQLGKNVVTSSKIKNKTIRSADIRNGAISSKKLRRSTLNALGTNSAPGPSGPAGPQGLPGADGVPGPQGREGPQGTFGPQGLDGDVGDNATIYAATVNVDGSVGVWYFNDRQLTRKPKVRKRGDKQYEITLLDSPEVADIAAALTTVQNPDAVAVDAAVDNDAEPKVITLRVRETVGDSDETPLFYVMLMGKEEAF